MLAGRQKCSTARQPTSKPLLTNTQRAPKPYFERFLIITAGLRQLAAGSLERWSGEMPLVGRLHISTSHKAHTFTHTLHTYNGTPPNRPGAHRTGSGRRRDDGTAPRTQTGRHTHTSGHLARAHIFSMCLLDPAPWCRAVQNSTFQRYCEKVSSEQQTSLSLNHARKDISHISHIFTYFTIPVSRALQFRIRNCYLL